MKRVKISSLDQLLKFISDETVTVENRYKIFLEAMKPYNFFVMAIRNNPDGIEQQIDNPQKVISEMQRIIKQLQTDSESHPAGFVLTRSNQ